MKKVQKIKLSEVDRIVMNSYRSVMEGLSDFLGEGFELILHSLEDFDSSVVNVIHGHHSGRRIGAAISDTALSMLVKIESEHLNGYISYDAVNRQGIPLRCSTIIIYGENHRAIGILAINFYMNTPVSDLFPVFAAAKHPLDSLIQNDALGDGGAAIQSAYDEAYLIVSRNDSITPSLRNKEIISILNNQGVFNRKDSVSKVAQLLSVSKNTVYMHLRSLKDK